jgi:hypothetical protein
MRPSNSPTLQHRGREAGPGHRHPAARLAHAHAAERREPECPARSRQARPARPPVQRRHQVGRGYDLRAQRGVGHHDGLLERNGPGDVGDGAGDRGRRHTVDENDLVRAERRGVDVQPAASPGARPAPVPRGVHAIQRDAPHGQPVQDRCRYVAHDDIGREPFQSSADEERMPRFGLVRQRALDVCATPDRAQRARPHHPADLVGAVAGGQQPSAEVHVS